MLDDLLDVALGALPKKVQYVVIAVFAIALIALIAIAFWPEG